jgi:hypothetical protein
MINNPYKPTTHHHQEWADRSIRRIKQLILEGLTYQAIADTLNAEGLRTIRGKIWTAVNLRQVIHALRIERNSWYGLSANRASFKVQQVAA